MKSFESRGQSIEKNVEYLREPEFAELIREHAVFKNEGNNGVIAELDIESAPEALQTYCLKKGLTEAQDETREVAKLLKIYRPGTAAEEFKRQKYAFDAVTKSKKPAAKIPKPRICAAMNIDPELRKALEGRLGMQAIGESVEVLVMDMVEGKDVATILYGEVLARHPNSEYREHQKAIEAMSFSQLQSEAFRLLDIPTRIQVKHYDFSKREAEEQKEWNKASKKIYEFLGKSGLRIHPELVERFRNAIEAFHEAGLVWGDGHERNFMIAGEYDAEKIAAGAKKGEAYLIDFGTAHIAAGERIDRGTAQADFSTVDKLQKMLMEGEPKEQDPLQKYYEIKHRLERRDARWRGVSEYLASQIESTGRLDARKLAFAFGTSGDRVERMIPSLLFVLEKHPQYRPMIKSAVHDMVSQKKQYAFSHRDELEMSRFASRL